MDGSAALAMTWMQRRSLAVRSAAAALQRHLRLLHSQPARFMPDCGLMFSSQQKHMGGKHDKLTDLSRFRNSVRRFRPPQDADRRSGACRVRRHDERRPLPRPSHRSARPAAPTTAIPPLPLGPLSGARYPDARLESMKKPPVSFGPTGFPAFAGTMAVERVATGFRWAEGPVYFPAGRYVLFSDIPNNRIMRFSEDDGHRQRLPPAIDELERQHHRSRGTPDHLRAFRPARHADRTRRLDHHHRRQVQRQEAELAERRGGRRRRYDLVLRSSLRHRRLSTRASRPTPSRTRRTSTGSIRRSGDIKVVVDDFVEPNGLCFSPDEKKLYICDTGFTDGPDNPSHIRVFDVDLAGGKALEQQGVRGNAQAQHHRRAALRHREGRVWCSVGWGNPNEDGVRCYTAEGDLLGKIHIPETVANLCFGGQQRNRLYICGSSSLYAVYTSAQGAMKP